MPPAPGVGFETALLLAGLVCTAAAWHAQRPWLRGLVGEWKVRRPLQRHSAEAMHDVLLRRPDSTGWTQIDHLVRLPDRILVLETKNLGGRLTASERDGRWTQRFRPGRNSSVQNPLRQNALHLAAVRAAAGREVRLQGLVLLVGQAWVYERLPMGCIGRFVRTTPARNAAGRPFGPTWEIRSAPPGSHRAAASGRLIDHWRHGAAIDRAHGRRPQLAPVLRPRACRRRPARPVPRRLSAVCRSAGAPVRYRWRRSREATMRRTSIGTWAFNVGPYGENPIPFPTVLEQLAELKFDGLELGGFTATRTRRTTRPGTIATG